MGCIVYLQRYDYSGISRGERKKAESGNGMELLRYAVKDVYAADLSTLDMRRGKHGKPYFAGSDIQFNISHSGDFAAAAVSAYPVGVDVQVTRSIKEGLIRKLCRGKELDYIAAATDKSRAFIHLWALKESYIKAIGMGMAFPMDEINFDILGFDGELQGRLSNCEGRYFLRDFGEFTLAVCSLS